MKIPLTILFIALTISTFGQITTTKVIQKIDSTKILSYDSTRNFLGDDLKKYVGQSFYLKGKNESLREFGYQGFYTYPKYSSYDLKSGVYKCCDGFHSLYDSLVGKYFKVIGVIDPPKGGIDEYIYRDKYFLKLQEERSGDIVYFEYDPKYEFEFPFIVVGYYDKLKRLAVGKEYVIAYYLSGHTDLQTGKEVTSKSGQKWKCIDITVDEKEYKPAYIIENEIGEKTLIPCDWLVGKDNYGKVFTTQEADNYKKRFGIEKFNLILEGKVRIGMTKEMCKLSWGEPKDINVTITSGSKSEQWVYDDNYLYFENGILTTIQ